MISGAGISKREMLLEASILLFNACNTFSFSIMIPLVSTREYHRENFRK
jgi:hypothetical protein